jgi:hypothetical protein
MEVSEIKAYLLGIFTLLVIDILVGLYKELNKKDK